MRLLFWAERSIFWVSAVYVSTQLSQHIFMAGRGIHALGDVSRRAQDLLQRRMATAAGFGIIACCYFFDGVFDAVLWLIVNFVFFLYAIVFF